MNPPELHTYETTIRYMISEGWSYDEISEHLTGLAGQSHGFSPRTVRRFCASRGIRCRSGIDEAHLDRIVRTLVTRVGHAYGRRTMHGLVHSQGVQVSQSRLAASLERVAPIQYAARRHETNRMLNPLPYRARYFGEKLHLDQNEKCVMFGVTHVVAIDGNSRKIVGFITIPKKNASVIYDLLFRPLLHSQGLWDQVRVDHGTEFALVITAQQYLSQYRQNHNHQPVLQSLSRQNHRAERIWPEINQRVNYPLKQVLIDMENNEELNMGDEVTKFCVSWVTIRVMHDAIHTFISAWNCHRIPGPEGGIPNTLALQNNRVTRLVTSSVPSTLQLIQLHEQGGNRLCRDATYGFDPLNGHPQLQELRERDLFILFPDLTVLFQDVLHNDAQLFKSCIYHFIFLTNNFALLIS